MFPIEGGRDAECTRRGRPSITGLMRRGFEAGVWLVFTSFICYDFTLSEKNLLPNIRRQTVERLLQSCRGSEESVGSLAAPFSIGWRLKSAANQSAELQIIANDLVHTVPELRF